MGKLPLASVVLLAACGAGVRADDAEAQRRALAALRQADPIVKVDEAKPEKPAVSIQFRPNYGKVSDDDLVHLKAFPSLRCVELPNKPAVTDAGLAHLAALHQLEELNLNGTNVTAAGVVRFVKGRTRLQRLELVKVPLRDDDLATLKDLTDLRVLSLRGTLVTDKGTVHLGAFTKLRTLNLSTREGLITDAALPHLKELTELEYLDLDRTGITDAGLGQLKSLRNLRGLQVAFTTVSDAGLEHLQTLSNLKELNARGTKVTKDGVDKLKQRLPELRVGFGPAPK
jgi:Leucine-rich repeat (LRR) protein